MKLTCLIFLLFFFAQIKRIKMQEFNNLYDTNIINNNVNNHYDVLILGAGISGLGAALTLSKTDKTFKILEAQNRAGGRIKTDTLKVFGEDNINTNINVEGGAQWLHSKNNYLYELAVEHNLIIDYKVEEGEEALGEFIRNDGYIYNKTFVKIIENVVKNILEKCELFAQENVTDYPKSVEDYLRDEFNQYLVNLELSEQIKAKELLDWHIRFEIIDNSCLTLKDLSAKSWGKYSYNGEESQQHINFKFGYNDLISVLINEINEKNILYNSEIVHINWNGKSEITNTPIIQVQTLNGNVYTANHIIITFSIGVLKTKLNQFTPKLPTLYSQTIEDLGMDTIGKIFLQWDDEPWWGDLMGIQMIWNDTIYDHWTRYFTGFDVAPAPQNTLLGWIGGHGVVEMESLSDNQIVLDCVEILSRFTKRTIPVPKNYYISRWHSDRFAKGSYSYATPKNDEHGTVNSDLLKPITLRHLKGMNRQKKDGFLRSVGAFIEHYAANTNLPDNDNYPIILFAGEGCHELFYATAHGAFLTGIDQAQKIINFHSPPN